MCCSYLISRDAKKGIFSPLSERGFVYIQTFLINIKYILFQIFNVTEIRLNFFLSVNISATYPSSLKDHPLFYLLIPYKK